MLGSFFFIQESQAVPGNESTPDQTADLAFEFLHKTFGEFLTADFLLRAVLEVVRSLHRLRKDKDIAELRDKLMRVDSPRKAWFAALSFVPLYTAPESLAMLREWLPHRLKNERFNKQELLEELDTMIYAQVGHMLNGTVFPATMTGSPGSIPYEPLPLLGYIATYTLNLILMRAWLTAQDYHFDQNLVHGLNEQGLSVWNRLVHVWQAWMPHVSLAQLTPLLSAIYSLDNRNIIIVRSSARRTSQQIVTSEGSLERILAVSEAIGDSTTGLLAELNLLGVHDVMPTSDLLDRLEAQHIVPDVGILLKVLSLVSYDTSLHIRLVSDFADKVSKRAMTYSHLGIMNALYAQIPEYIAFMPESFLLELLNDVSRRNIILKKEDISTFSKKFLKSISAYHFARSLRANLDIDALLDESGFMKGVKERHFLSSWTAEFWNRSRRSQVDIRHLFESEATLGISLDDIINRLPIAMISEVIRLLNVEPRPSIYNDLLVMCHDRIKKYVRLFPLLSLDALENFYWLSHEMGDDELQQQITDVLRGRRRSFTRQRITKSAGAKLNNIKDKDKSVAPTESAREVKAQKIDGTGKPDEATGEEQGSDLQE